jgi:broad specificity phosphatase PhoE
VWLIRHGETEWSLSGQHSGRVDLPLTPRGEEEARALTGMLAGLRFDRVLCSPLARARRTCEIAGFLAAAEIDPEVQEWDYGDCTGFTQQELQARFPGWNIWSGPVPNGESIEEIAARARRVAARVRGEPGRVAVFAHGHFLRIFSTQWVGLAPTAARHLALETAAICVLGADGGFPAIRAWNVKSANGAGGGGRPSAP